MKSKTNSFNLRSVLVVSQFAVAITLIISTLIISRQVSYVQHREIGFDRNNLVELRMKGDIQKNYELIKQELMNSRAAISVCQTGLPITMDNGSQSGFEWGNPTEEQKEVKFSMFATTGNFVKTMGLKLLAGRDIDLMEYKSDSSAILINETAAHKLGLQNPIGEIVRNNNQNYTIVGVIKDFINGSPNQRMEPMIVLGSKYWHWNMAIRLNSNNISQSLKVAGGIFKKYNAAYPFEYHFADEEYNKKFQDEIKAEQLIGIFAVISIIISCLGLFGLATFSASQRTKEIGVRKVLGASVTNLWALLSKEFVVLVIISLLIASPIAYYFMNDWIQKYTYRTDISWWIFVAAGAGALAITIATVSFQAIKAAIANPVKSLRTE